MLQRCAIAVLVSLALSNVVSAQTITGVVISKNSGNSANEFSGDAVNPSFERESTVEILAAGTTNFTTRYSAIVSADSGLFGVQRLEVLNSDYTISFSVTAPVGYQLAVTTRRSGDMHLVEDNIFVADHYADVTALTGAQSGGTLVGFLSLPDPGRQADIPFVFDPISLPFNQTANATISGISNGSPVAHTLTFNWSQEAYSPAQGDEAAVRFGGTSHDNTEIAADYPGAPARTKPDDGHFVTVTLTSLCGNGVLNAGEQCDLGVGNGFGASCCTANCQFRVAGAACRLSTGLCDPTETCTGASALCPTDVLTAAGVECRGVSSGDFCDEPEICTGTDGACPADLVKPMGTECRPDSGACDVAESCDGAGKQCPADAFEAPGTACGSNSNTQCSNPDTCDGSGSCSVNNEPDGTPCDDGIVCSGDDQCSGGVCSGDLGMCPLDHYKCYQGRDLKNPRFDPISVATTDQIDSENVDVKKLKFVCAPVDTNGQGINDPVSHLACYQIIADNLSSRPGVEVSTQFQTSRFELKKGKLLCVPGTKTLIP